MAKQLYENEESSGLTTKSFLWIKRKDITDGQGVLYLRRWILGQCRGWRLMLHKIVRADHDRCRHNHPWGFFGLILKGGYEEELDDGVLRVNKPFQFINRLKPSFSHRITRLCQGPSWTLLLTTPFQQEWGFHTPEGWMPWQKFLAVKESIRVLWCGTDKG